MHPRQKIGALFGMISSSVSIPKVTGGGDDDGDDEEDAEVSLLYTFVLYTFIETLESIEPLLLG